MQNRESFPRRVTILIVPEAICITAIWWVDYKRICIYLSLEQHRLEVHVPTYMWNFFPIYPRMWSCGYGGSTVKFPTAGRIENSCP